jgi:dolichol-phosphate mannosyltransferase
MLRAWPVSGRDRPAHPPVRGGKEREAVKRPAVKASVIIPTRNERSSLPETIESLRRWMQEGDDWEIIVVDDDSPDRTWEVAQNMAVADPRIRVYRRIDRRGLSSAIVDGLSLGAGDRLLVMDADMQHDASKVPELFASLEGAALAIGTRYVDGGGTGDWSSRRRWMSRFATRACQLALGIRANDPMSGFFAIRREDFSRVAPRLNPKGYKILMEILHVMRPVRIAEVPYTFATRRAGESKLGGRVVFDFGLSLIELVTRRMLRPRFIKYSLVGLTGVAVQAAMASLLLAAEVRSVAAIATGVAAVSNFMLNNRWTFADRRLDTPVKWWRGLLSFMAISATGAVINVALSQFMHGAWGVHPALAGFTGLAVSTVWNYNLNHDFTWRTHAFPE